MPLQGRPGIRGAARRNARRHLVRLPGAGADLWLAGGPGTVRRRRRVASGRFTGRCDPVRLAAGRAGTPRSDGPVRGRPGATRGTLVAWSMPGFSLTGLWAAILTSIVVGLTSWFASAFVGGSGRIERYRRIEVTGRRLD